MVNATELGGFFYRHHIPDVLYDTNQVMVSFRTGTDGTYLRIRNIMAILAINDLFAEPGHGIPESFHFREILPEQVQGKPQGGLPADAGQLCQFADGVLQ